MLDNFQFKIVLLLTAILTPSSITQATEHGNPDGSCDLLCEAEVECEGHNQAWAGFPVIFDLVVDDSDNSLVRSFCVYQDGLVIIKNTK